VRDLLSSDGMRLLPHALTLAELLASGEISLDERSGRARMVASFGAPIFVHVPKTVRARYAAAVSAAVSAARCTALLGHRPECHRQPACRHQPCSAVLSSAPVRRPLC
jgi:hypothetical protein